MSNTLTIATDGSAAQTRKGVWAGWSWVSSTGGFEAGHKHTGSILLAELVAIDRALAGTLRGAARKEDVLILTDSQAALRIVQHLLEHSTLQHRAGVPHHMQVARTARHIAEQVRAHREGRVELAWVRGHSGHPLNEAADRLARHCRISGGATTAAVTALYKQISHDAATAWAHATGPPHPSRPAARGPSTVAAAVTGRAHLGCVTQVSTVTRYILMTPPREEVKPQ